MKLQIPLIGWKDSSAHSISSVPCSLDLISIYCLTHQENVFKTMVLSNPVLYSQSLKVYRDVTKMARKEWRSLVWLALLICRQSKHEDVSQPIFTLNCVEFMVNEVALKATYIASSVFQCNKFWPGHAHK